MAIIISRLAPIPPKLLPTSRPARARKKRALPSSATIAIRSAVQLNSRPVAKVGTSAAATADLSGYALGLAAYALKLAALGAALAVLETAIAKMRVFRVPQFLGAALMLGLLGMLLLFVSRSL